jgi:hypothetical protein
MKEWTCDKESHEESSAHPQVEEYYTGSSKKEESDRIRRGNLRRTEERKTADGHDFRRLLIKNGGTNFISISHFSPAAVSGNLASLICTIISADW